MPPLLVYPKNLFTKYPIEAYDFLEKINKIKSKTNDCYKGKD